MMPVGYSENIRTFLNTAPELIRDRLATDQIRSHRTNEAQQLRAWEGTIAVLRAVLAELEEALEWRILLEFHMLRLGRRIDALLVTPRGVLVLEFKVGSERVSSADLLQVEDYALDLQNFHAASRGYPIVPILIATEAPAAALQLQMFHAGAAHPITCSARDLLATIRLVWAAMPRPSCPIASGDWEHAAYQPVPGIVEAACMLYQSNTVAEIGAARADAQNLGSTTRAILTAIGFARDHSRHVIVFVTGIPGAGKTLCGLNVVFGSARDDDATFLTGNPSLIHVLREALKRDAATGDRSGDRAKRRSTETLIQSLPAVRDLYVGNGQTPSDRIIVVDEAQRAWSRDYAIKKSQDRKVRLTDSEPGHILELVGRHEDWAVIVCLIGGGQEIHDGEGGLEEWGRALLAQPKWLAWASPRTLKAVDPRQRLPELPGLQVLNELHLSTPIRNIRSDAAAAWVDAVLANDSDTARGIAEQHGPLPFWLTRSLVDLRGRLRHMARGQRRAGLVASSGAKRLRADGLGSEVDHMDAVLVARWFLDRWPDDVRASGALEQVATEFSCQGLELDYVGLCWGGDLIRQAAWVPSKFVGTEWQTRRRPEAISNRVKTYRVLLTRARYDTIIWVPLGDQGDRTRLPAEFEAIAAYLLRCGVGVLPSAGVEHDAPPRERLLL